MSSLNTITGRLGKHVIETTLIARIKKWDVSQSLANKNEWGDSDSEGYTNRSAGRKDATFSNEGVYDTSSEVWDLFAPGDITKSVLWMNATLYWAFSRALASDFKISVNVDTEEVVGWTGDFGADGVFYRPGQAGTPVESLP